MGDSTLLVDVSMLVHRVYASMDFLKNSAGVSTGMEYGTLRTLESLQKKYSDHEIVLCFDSRTNRRKEQSKTYKANRKQPSSQFYHRFNSLKVLLGCLYNNVEKEGYEADDLMFSIATTYPGSHIIYTNDHDLLQAVNDRVIVLKSFHSKLFVWDVDKIKKEYGVRPEMLPEYFAFIGDKVDNIVGVSRIPKKFLAELIVWGWDLKLALYSRLREILEADWPPKMKDAIAEFHNSDQWQRNYELIRLKSVPCNIALPTHNLEYVKTRLEELEIYSLEISKSVGTVCNEEF